jgi:hypothetical protein
MSYSISRKLKCAPGNVPCGGKCQPRHFKCQETTQQDGTYANTKVLSLLNDPEKSAGNAIGIRQHKDLFSSIINFIPDLIKDLHKNSGVDVPESQAYNVNEKNNPELQKRYAKLQPGDIVGKVYLDESSNSKILHYGIYVGIDKKTGDPQVVENTLNRKQDSGVAKKTHIVRLRSMYTKEENMSSKVKECSWVKVESPSLPRPHVVERSLASIGKIHNYALLDSNCEHLARYLANNDFYSTAAEFKNNVVVSIVRSFNANKNTNNFGMTAPELVQSVDKGINTRKIKVSKKIAQFSQKLVFNNVGSNFTQEFKTQNYSEQKILSESKKFSSGNGLLPLNRVLENIQASNIDSTGQAGKMLIEQILKYYLILANVNKFGSMN